MDLENLAKDSEESFQLGFQEKLLEYWLGFLLALVKACLEPVETEDFRSQWGKMLEVWSVAVFFVLEMTQSERTVLSVRGCGLSSFVQWLSFRSDIWRRSGSRGTRRCWSGACTGMEASFSSDGDGRRDG